MSGEDFLPQSWQPSILRKTVKQNLVHYIVCLENSSFPTTFHNFGIIDDALEQVPSRFALAEAEHQDCDVVIKRVTKPTTHTAPRVEMIYRWKGKAWERVVYRGE